jgi:hypothetical protein
LFPMRATCPVHHLLWIYYSNYAWQRYKWNIYYAILSSHLLLHPSLVKIISSVPCSQIFSIYILPLK